MHPVIVEKPYSFVPPYPGNAWPRFLQQFARRRLRREFGIADIQCRGLDRLRASLAAGHGVMLTPNHSRPCDPLLVSELCRQAGTAPFVMASWHIFMQGRLKAFLLRRAGVFSVYREGMDRQSLQAGIDILNAGTRPLVIFPEGHISRTNDRLAALMEGPSFIARSAAKRRAEASSAKQVVIHPVAIRYFFHGDVHKSLHPVLDDIERRMSWSPKRHLDLYERIYKVGEALLCLKELEYFGQPQSGTIGERTERLIDHILVPLEQEWLNGRREKTVVLRVKKLRVAVLPDMVNGQITDEERDRRWKHLADMYLAQQIGHYPPDYIKSKPTPERMLETVERFEEDLTDKSRMHSPLSAIIQVGEAIPVATARDRGAAEDPIMSSIESGLRTMLDEMANANK